MKKMKLLALGLATVLATVSLTGCQSTPDSSEESVSESSSEEVASSDAASVEGTSKETFTIGGIGPLTGEAASYGLSVKQGAEIAVEEINAAGGVQVGDTTYMLTLKFEDDQAAQDKAVTAYNALMDSGMNALLGCVTTGSCLAVVDLAKEDNILMLTPSGSAAEITANDNVFRLCFTDPLQGETMASHMVNDLGYKNIAVIYDNSDAYSTGVYEEFAAKVVEFGGTIATAVAFSEGEDFNTQLTSIKATDAEAIFAPVYYSDAAQIATQAADLSIALPMLGADGWDGVLGTVTDAAVVEGAEFLSPFFSGDSSAADFVGKYQSAYNATPDQFAADGYDCVYVFKAAMESAGTIDSDALISAMTAISVDGLTGSGISFTANGEPQKDARFIKIVNGEYTMD